MHFIHKMIILSLNRKSFIFQTFFCFILFFSISISQAQKQYPYGLIHKKNQIEIIDTNFLVSNIAFGGSAFIGYGFNFNNISSYFTNPILGGITLDFHFKKLLFQAETKVGFGKTKKEMIFSDGYIWEKDEFTFSVHPSLKIGYSFVDNQHILLTPTIGVGTKTITSNFLFTEEHSTYNPLLALCKIGVFIDVKSLLFMQIQIRINNKEVNYISLRLSVIYDVVIGKPKYTDYFYGNMLYFTIGLGGLERRYYRKNLIEKKYI